MRLATSDVVVDVAERASHPTPLSIKALLSGCLPANGVPDFSATEDIRTAAEPGCYSIESGHWFSCPSPPRKRWGKSQTNGLSGLKDKRLDALSLRGRCCRG